MGTHTSAPAVDADRPADGLRRLRADLGVDTLLHAVHRDARVGLLDALARYGAGFEITSYAYLGAVLDAGADPATVLHASPAAPAGDLRRSYADGVRRFLVDTRSELVKLASVAPGADVLVRIAAPLCAPAPTRPGPGGPREALRLLCTASSLGLHPFGLAVDLGTGAAPVAWAAAIGYTAAVARALEPYRVHLSALALAGGVPFPGRELGTVIATTVRACWPYPPEVLLEPGGEVVADAALPGPDATDLNWLYLDTAAEALLVA